MSAHSQVVDTKRPDEVATPTSTRGTITNDPLRATIRRNRQRRVLISIAQVLVLVVFVAAWQILSGPDMQHPWVLIDSYYVSQPSEVWDALREWLNDGVLVESILETAQATIIGLLLGMLLGLAVGFALGVNRTLGAVLQPLINALYSIPRLALIPLFLLWFGIGLAPKLAMVITIVFFLVFYSTFSGVRDVDRQLLDSVRLMGASRWQIYRKVILQSAMMWIIAGLRIAVPYALVAAVTAEMLIGDSGMGFLVVRSTGQFYTAGVFAAITVMMLMAMALMAVVTVVEKRALHWKSSVQRGTAP